MSETEAPIVVVFVEHHGRYRVEFDFDARAVVLLKATVPAPMRRWRAQRWEVGADWVGPLASAFVNAGIKVVGLDRTNISDWFGVFSAAMPTSPSGHRAYAKGFCKRCESNPHRPGGVECEDCHRQRLAVQHHVKASMAQARALPYPEALPAVGNATTTRFPLEIDRADVAIVERDHTAMIDLLIAAEHDRSTTCPICGRKPAKGVAVHALCRTRLLHALDESRAFTRARNRAFQDGACTVCSSRPQQVPGSVTCTHCAEIIDVCRLLRCAEKPCDQRK